jgi:hypothetical protein
MNSTRNETFQQTAIGTVMKTGVGVHMATFKWVANPCEPTLLNETAGYVLEDCPEAGTYNLCYFRQGGMGVPTEISVTAVQSYPITNLSTFDSNTTHHVNNRFSVLIFQLDANGYHCCAGTRVYLSLFKSEVDHSGYLYNGAGHNSIMSRSLVATDFSGKVAFQNYSIKHTAGLRFHFTVSVPGFTLRVPTYGYFIVRPSGLIVETRFAPEYIVGRAAAATLPPQVRVRAVDMYGNLLVGLSANDGLHCEVQLQTGGHGQDSAVYLAMESIGNGSVTEDLQPIHVQKDGEERPLFEGGVAVLKNMTILNQAGRCVSSQTHVFF